MSTPTPADLARLLNLDTRQSEILISELRNALVPTFLRGRQPANEPDAGVERALALVDAVANHNRYRDAPTRAPSIALEKVRAARALLVAMSSQNPELDDDVGEALTEAMNLLSDALEPGMARFLEHHHAELAANDARWAARIKHLEERAETAIAALRGSR